MTVAPAAVTVHALCHSFDGMPLLAGLDLEVDRGECVSVADDNGRSAGALLAILATLVRPTSGRVLIAGVDAVAHPALARRRVAYAGPGLPGDRRLTAGEYLRLATISRGLRSRSVIAAAARMGIDPRAPATALNADMRHRLHLAAALVAARDVALLDTPFRGLGDEARAPLGAWVEELRGAGTAIIVAAPAGEEADPFGSRVVRLEHGRAASRIPPRTPALPGIP
jgi:ABC-2 type transport system ATP-binding protein